MPKKFSPRFALVASMGILCLALAPAAIAAKGGGAGGGSGGSGASSSLSLVMVNDLNSNRLPNWGDTVTFNVSTTASYPEVLVECSQSGALVFSQRAGFFPSYMWSKDFTLKSSSWTGGAADCAAWLYYSTKNGTFNTVATLSFHVEA
jgi:hypothetical protein